jgi:hypothetical protein
MAIKVNCGENCQLINYLRPLEEVVRLTVCQFSHSAGGTNSKRKTKDEFRVNEGNRMRKESEREELVGRKPSSAIAGFRYDLT